MPNSDLQKLPARVLSIERILYPPMATPTLTPVFLPRGMWSEVRQFGPSMPVFEGKTTDGEKLVSLELCVRQYEMNTKPVL